jgi:hypothetical protein
VSIPSTGFGRRFGTIADATEYSGISRTSLYRLGAVHKRLFRKFQSSTLVDFHVLDEILDALPTAEIAEQS